MGADMLCLCGCARTMHKARGSTSCRLAGCDCDRFEVDDLKPPLTTTTTTTTPAADAQTPASPDVYELLALAEQDRDQAIREREALRVRLAAVRAELELRICCPYITPPTEGPPA